MAADSSKHNTSGATVGRADLLMLLLLCKQEGEAEKQAAARLAGFAYRAPVPVATPEPAPAEPVSSAPATTATPAGACTRPRAEHYSATLSPLPNTALADDYAKQLAQFTSAEILPEPQPDRTPPPWQPLASARRLVVFAEKCLRHLHASQQWDTTKLAQQLAHGMPPNLRRVRKQRLRWQGNALVLFQQPETEPLHRDYQALVQLVQRRSGGQVAIFSHLAGFGWSRYQGTGSTTGPLLWQALAQPPQLAGMRGLAVGWPPMSASGVTVWPRQWLPHARLVAAPAPNPELPTNAQPDQATGPAHPWPVGAAQPTRPPAARLPLAWWDVGQRLALRRQGSTIPTTAAQLQALLALLTLAVQVHPPLLRALRCVLGLPASAELAAWQSEDVACNSVAIAVRLARRSHYEAILQSSIALPLRQQAAAIIAAHHCQLSFPILLEESQLAAQYAPGSTTLNHAAYFASLARQLWQHSQQPGSGPEDYAENMAYLTRQGLRTSSIIWENSPAFALGWALSNLDSLRHGHGLPETMPLALLPALQQAVLGSGGVAPEKNLRLLQEDGSLRLEYGTPKQANTAPRLLAQWPSHGMLRWRSGKDGVWQAVQAAQNLPQFDLARHTPLEIADGSMVCTLQRVVRPGWALECGRDRNGVYALLPNPWGEPVRLAWPFHAMEPIAMPVAKNKEKASVQAKVHALTLGLDKIGAFATLMLAGKSGLHSQVWRYIAPGQFLMGSPEAETQDLPDQKLYAHEQPQHRVTINQGFWLAETTCTQGLWQAVMGDNPSRFDASGGGGANYPVEQVSWYDIQVFLQKLQALLDNGVSYKSGNGLTKGLVTLPTEAEWEYACRAGTSTPFCFGNSISTEQANFDGNYPWNDGKKSKFHKKTLNVKDLPANAWGLHQMHGNVWEWCVDEKRQYSTAEMINPGLDAALLSSLEPKAARVVRGGGWFNSAQDVRSAYRSLREPDWQLDDLGFRMALRSQ